LSDTHRLLGLAFAAADLLIEIDEKGRVGLVVGGVRALLGCDERALRGRQWRDMVAAKDQDLVAALHEDLGDGQRRGPILVRLVCGDELRSAELTVRSVPGSKGRSAWALLASQQSTMPVSDDLADQAAFEDLTRSLMEAARATGMEYELALIELTGLLQGAATLDATAAKAMTDRLTGALRAGSHRGIGAAQLADERFAVIRKRGDGVDALARRLTAAMTPDLGGGTPPVRIHTLPLDLGPPAKAMRALRFALDDFVRDGVTDNGPASLAEAMSRSVKRTLARAGALGTAVTQRRFTLAFQPVVDLADCVPHHHEVLVRFEDGGSPFAMIRMAEEFDLIEELDHAIVDQTIKRLSAADAKDLRLAVNVSGQTITSETYLNHVSGLIKSHPRVRGRLIFEITESSAIDDLPRADRHIQALRGLGSLVCLDDFGAGAASFAYLQQLRLDIVKIDGRYVRELAANGRDAAMVRHLVRLCGELKVRTVAEMVETKEVQAVVRAAGVDFAQGWLYGRPNESPAIKPPPSVPARRKGSVESWG
jgi:EAL domain-containing protein (putative c-di-GMP-specific phosphodiesterase class I)